MVNEPVKMAQGDIIFIRSICSDPKTAHMKISLVDSGLYIQVDPFLFGEKHFFTLFDFLTMFLRDNPLSLKKWIGNTPAKICAVTSIDLQKNEIELTVEDGFEIFDPQD